MNTNSLKRFATTARSILLRGVSDRLQSVGFNPDGSVRETPQAVPGGTLLGDIVMNDPHFAPRWEALLQRIQFHGVKEVIEEAAYTWFNRLMAIRILVRNGLAQAVLDYENPDVRLPRIVTDARAGKTPILTPDDSAALHRVIADGRLAFEQFAILIRAYCENDPILRSCFGGITDYTMLLLPADIVAPGNFLDLLNESDSYIAPDDYTKPELIGWLYQFYISDKKDEVFAKKGGYNSDEIPAATQIFTPNWIVKYMVQNTLGSIYLDNNSESALAANWKYLVKSAEPTPAEAVLHYNSLEDLRCADLSCGSGHILNEMFDLLMQLYEDDFYSPREAIEAIFTKNMVGLDIDIRARQLSQFALLLKACQRDSAFADGHCLPRIHSFPDVDRYTWADLSGHFNCAYQLDHPGDNTYNQLADAFAFMADANVLGSIMKFDMSDATIGYLRSAVAAYDAEPKFTDSFASLVDAFRVILALTDKYAAICMNPPYMPTNKEATLKTYAAKNYPDSKSDLFAVFMDVAIDRLFEHGKYGMINMQSWMFLSSYESLRKNIIDNQQIDSLLHLGPRTFDELSGEVVQNAAFVISKESPSYPGIYYRLIDGTNCAVKRNMFFAGENRYVVADQQQFEQIPGAPIAYWVTEKIRETFTNNLPLSAVCKPTQGLATADNGRFVRSWFEVAKTSIGFGCESASASVASGRKFFPYNKGGAFRKWYGNRDLIVNWENDGEEIRNFSGAVIRNPSYYFKEGITFPRIGSDKFSARFCEPGFIFDCNGPTCFPQYDLNYALGFLNSNTMSHIVQILCPTISFQIGDSFRVPYVYNNNYEIDELVVDCISISKQDWDAHETSWDFQCNPLLYQAKDMPTETIVFGDKREKNMEILYPELARCDANLNGRQTTVLLSPNSLKSLYIAYRQKWTHLFGQLLSNEEEINRKFIEIYDLQDELSPVVGYENITILQQGEMTADGDDVDGTVLCWHPDVIIKQFISYAVGCMMGRYRLDRPGLAIAHPNPSAEEIAPYAVSQTGEQWWIDDDGIVPMMGDDCGFHDNAANRFTEFLRVTFGDQQLTENMNFVRDALGKDVVDYLRTDFYADHKRMYQNRPIYWMFSSNQKGKRAAFQCLVYMHRMNRFTPEHIRTEYLLPYIETLAARETELSGRPSLSAKENKELKQLRADLDECRDYQLRLHEFADRQIEIDLDDGVVKNYATFAPVLAKLK